MKRKTVHEPSVKLMSAADTNADVTRLKELFREQALRSAPAVVLRIPLASFLAALDQLPRKDLLEVKQKLDERLMVYWLPVKRSVVGLSIESRLRFGSRSR